MPPKIEPKSKDKVYADGMTAKKWIKHYEDARVSGLYPLDQCDKWIKHWEGVLAQETAEVKKPEKEKEKNK